MKSWDVYMDSFVNILLPDNVDPDTVSGSEILYHKAIEKFKERLDSEDISLNWDRYEDGDSYE